MDSTFLIQQEIFSVGELTREIKLLIEQGFPLVRVEGEISDFMAARSGHWYFTLKDPLARISCVMFKGNNRYIKEVPKNGDRILVAGRINVYEPRGQYQLIADSLQPRGLGLLFERFEALKNKLEAEGLFDDSLKRPLPQYPEKIALVTSEQGAALQDMIRVAGRRNPTVSLVLVPTLVQGADAPGKIVKAIEKAGKLEVDLVIVGRGGGSLEDLWAFNDEAVARAIRSCPKPLISAVGHETDFTIADFAADVRAATPSVGAELAVPLLSDIVADLSSAASRLDRAMHGKIVGSKLRLSELQSRLISPAHKLDRQRLTLDHQLHRLTNAIGDISIKHRQSLQNYKGRLELLHPEHLLQSQKLEIKHISNSLKLSIHGLLRQRKEELRRLATKLDALSPLAVLNRGYSLVMDENEKPIIDAAELNVGDRLHIYPAKGRITAEVQAIGGWTVGKGDK